MNSSYFIIRCCECDRDILLSQTKELQDTSRAINENIAIEFKGNECGIFCECGNCIEIF